MAALESRVPKRLGLANEQVFCICMRVTRFYMLKFADLLSYLP